MGKAVGDFLRVAREKAGVSQALLSERLRLKSAQSISNIERGVAPLTQAKVADVAKILGFDPEDIVEVIIGEVREKYLRIVEESDKRRRKSKRKLAGLYTKKART